MRPAVLTVAAIALLIFPTARAGDVDDLKATVLKELKAYGERDCKTVIGLRTDPTIAYSPNNPEPVEWGKAESLKRCADGTFDNWADLPEAKAVFTPVDPKDGSPRTSEMRRMETWVKSDGQWQRAAFQMSAVPSGN